MAECSASKVEFTRWGLKNHVNTSHTISALVHGVVEGYYMHVYIY